MMFTDLYFDHSIFFFSEKSVNVNESEFSESESVGLFISTYVLNYA